MQKVYCVELKEITYKYVTVDATNEREARLKAKKLYENKSNDVTTDHTELECGMISEVNL